ncbi:MAG: alpha/beta hydrolase-fold protein [Planctomycetota bacterium]|nr:alpha/beta hydrolase-fold protein [Planctomycetota bacterium]
MMIRIRQEMGGQRKGIATRAMAWAALWGIMAAAAMTAGCPQVRHGALPSKTFKVTESSTGRGYYMYVPSYYHAGTQWPLVVTLHGTYGYDWASEQAKEWDSIAEKCGFIVVAPELKSVQGILPVPRDTRRAQLEADDQAILTILDEVCGNYSVDKKAVLLTGFSAGGFPLWNTGLKHPERFCMLISRNCNLDMELVRSISFTDVTRKLPMKIYWGKDDVDLIRKQGWEMLQFLRLQRQCYEVTHKKVAGGHFRSPDQAYSFWQEHLPTKYQTKKGHWPPAGLPPERAQEVVSPASPPASPPEPPAMESPLPDPPSSEGQP